MNENSCRIPHSCLPDFSWWGSCTVGLQFSIRYLDQLQTKLSLYTVLPNWVSYHKDLHTTSEVELWVNPNIKKKYTYVLFWIMCSEFSCLLMIKMPHWMTWKMWIPRRSSLNFNFQEICVMCLKLFSFANISRRRIRTQSHPLQPELEPLFTSQVFLQRQETSPILLIFLMPLTCPRSYNYLCCRQWIPGLAVEPYDFSSLLPFLSLCFSVSCSSASCCQPLKTEKKKQ